MKKIMAIVLVSLLGFLGCSGSDDGTLAVGEAIPVAPSGIVETPNPTYEWTPVRLATRYRLVVQDTNEASTTADTNEAAIIDEWYTAEEAGCASEDGLCEATPDAEVIGKNEFQVQACANDECGLRSESMQFDFTPMGAPRFTDNGNQTVTDNKTKLMWSKDANLYGEQIWQNALELALNYMGAGYVDWRLPELTELRSLIDTSHWNPALPLGHPFTNVQDNWYWTRTLWWEPNTAWYVDVAGGDVGHWYRDDAETVWPVRSVN